MALTEFDTWPPRKAPLLIVISGPSGAGKDSVLTGLRPLCPEIHFAITATTRPMREHEEDGRDYLFLSPQAFERLRIAARLLESALVYGYWYGVPRDPIDQAIARGQDVIVKVDVQGAASIRALFPHSIAIFLAPGSIGELETRLWRRKSETPEARALRLATAREELDLYPRFDYLVINTDGALERALSDVRGIIAAERCRVDRQI